VRVLGVPDHALNAHVHGNPPRLGGGLTMLYIITDARAAHEQLAAQEDLEAKVMPLRALHAKLRDLVAGENFGGVVARARPA